MMMALQVYSVECFIDKRPGIKWLIYDGIHMHYHSVEKCLNKNLVSWKIHAQIQKTAM